MCSTLPLYPGVLTLLRYSCGTNGIPTPHHPTPHFFSVCSRSCALHSFIHSDADLSISDGKFCEKCARKTFSKSNLQNASIFGVLFVIVVLWMGTGTVFYKLYLGWSWEMSFYYAVQAGFCVGFGGTYIARNLSTCTVPRTLHRSPHELTPSLPLPFPPPSLLSYDSVNGRCVQAEL